MRKITLITLMLFTALSYAQVGINTNTPDASSALEIESTTGGILIPRMTEAQRDAIVSPASGLMIYQTNETSGFYFYNGTLWTKIDGVAGPQGPAGSQGPAGTDGADGAQGPAGAAGPVGPAGADGADGAQGPQGPTGPTGPIGPIGPAGADGADGAQGPQGDQGIQGATGAQGPQGPAGSQGLTGPVGPTGPTGSQGPVGPAGADGADGAQGPVGNTGPAGPQGDQGIQGPTGLAGADGADGAQGPQGDQGIQGPTGATGPQGLAGVDGADGNDGNGIASTVDNNDGTFTLTFDDNTTFTTSDLTGPQGPQGVPGTDGADGIDGEDGQGGVTTVSDGLTLSGSGTETDPYIISLPPGGTEGQLLTILNGVPVWADCNNPNTYYLDADDDGYGDPNNATSSCEPINGYVDNNTDCNDTNASVNPAATEIEDGIDNDCNGDLDEGFIESYGDQVWTLENADVVTYRDGTPIPEVTSDTDWGNLTTGAWAHYNNDTSNPRIYNGYAVMGIHDSASLLDETLRKEFSPEGWHVPTDEEWIILENQLIANGYNYDGSTTGDKLGKSMASTTGWNNNTETGNVGQNQSTNNSSGFNAFPEGRRDSDATFNLEGLAAKFWTATEAFDTDKNWSYSIYNDRSDLLKDWDFLKTGLSVRFVKD
jgi:uncharacterized protein (TIGR02145 family)